MSISISDGQNIRKVSLSINKKRFFHLFPKVPLRCLLFSVGVPKFPRSKLCKFNVGPWSCAKQFLCRRARLVAPVNPASKFIRWYFESICWYNYKLKRLVLDQCVVLIWKIVILKNYSVVKMLLEKMQATDPMIFFQNSCTWKTTSLVWILSFETKWLVMYSYIFMFITIFSSAY